MKKLEVGLMVVAVAAGAVVTSMWLDLREERSKAVEIATRLTAAESMQPAQAAAPQTPVTGMPVVAVTSSQTAAAPANQPSAARAANSPTTRMLEAMSTPEAKGAMRNMMRREMARMYPDIEQELGITAQEKQKLFDLLSDEGQDYTEMMLAMQDPTATREMQRLMVEAETAQEKKVSALLGNRYPSWEDYQGTVAARNEVSQLRKALDASGNPLSESQSQQLVSAFAFEKRRASKEDREWNHSSAAINSPKFFQEMMQRDEDSGKRMVNAASSILNSAQLDRYKKSVEQDSTMMRTTMEMMTGAGKP